jgi:uncharacterized iron-regulated membrane protein
MELVLLAAAFVLAMIVVTSAKLVAWWQRRARIQERLDTIPPVPRGTPALVKPHNPFVDTRLGAVLPPDQIRALYRLAGLAEPSCHCDRLPVPHLAEHHP